MIEPIAITVAARIPTPRESAQAITPARPSPLQWLDHGGREMIIAPRDAAMGKEIACENEERDRHDLEIVDAGEQF